MRLSLGRDVKRGDRVEILPSSGPLPQRDKTRQVAKVAVRETVAKLQASIAEQYAFVGTMSECHETTLESCKCHETTLESCHQLLAAQLRSFLGRADVH
jgi:hypothetical protein